MDLARGLLLLPDSKTGRKTIVLSAPALSILAELPRVGAFVIAGESAGTKDEKPRADLKRPWADRGLVLHLSHGAKQLTASGLRRRRSCD